MRRTARLAILVVLGSLAVSALADDREKAVKQLRMMTAMSRDTTARGVLSRTFADTFKVPRPELLSERKTLGLNYGSLFLARQMVLSGVVLEQVASQLQLGKAMVQVADERHVDWKHIAGEAKKMNSRIHDRIYDHFLHDEPDKERDRLEQYDPAQDVVKADADASADEILKAANEYVFWRNLAAPKSAGQADGNSVVGHSYTRARDDIAATHGTTSPASGDR